MYDNVRWYEFLGLAVVAPASLIGSAWLLGWLTKSDPLIDEIWRLRGRNSVLRERLDQLERAQKNDSDRLRDTLPPCDRRTATLRVAHAPSK